MEDSKNNSVHVAVPVETATDTRLSGTCDCDLCKRIRRFDEELKKIPKASHEYFENLYSLLFETEADLHYYKSIVDGSWPSAEEILERALEKVKAKRQSGIKPDLPPAK